MWMGWDADGGLGGGTDGRGGGDGQEGYRDILSWLEDNVAQVTLGTDPNDPLAYAPVLEHHHLISSTLGEPRGRLGREIEMCSTRVFLAATMAYFKQMNTNSNNNDHIEHAVPAYQ